MWNTKLRKVVTFYFHTFILNDIFSNNVLTLTLSTLTLTTLSVLFIVMECYVWLVNYDIYVK